MPTTAKIKRPASAKRREKKESQSIDIKNLNSEQMLFYLLQRMDTKIDNLDKKVEDETGKLDNKLENRIDKLESKIDSNFKWTIGIMLSGFLVVVGLIFSLHFR